MSAARTALHAKHTSERRPAPAVARRVAAAATPSPAQTLRQRLGERATQALIARSPTAQVRATGESPTVKHAVPSTVQLSKTTRLPAKISKPHDPAELEAEEMARKVVRPSASSTAAPPRPKDGSKATVQRAVAPVAGAPVPRGPEAIQATGGAPLPAPGRSFMESRFGASFAHVRIHTDAAAARQSAALGAQAFTVGPHVFFGRDRFQPESTSGRELIAHELTHTIQQGATIQRSVDATVTQRVEPTIQRLPDVIGNPLDRVADLANDIPGFRLLTIVLGMNPINLAAVDRSAVNILCGVLELLPIGGVLLVQALQSHGVLDKVASWFEERVKSLRLVGSSLKRALDTFIDSLSAGDVFNLGAVWERGKRIFTAPIASLISLGTSVVSDILGFIRDAILLPIARLAEGTRGYDLLRAVLGKDPITGEQVRPSAETLIGGFMTLIGQEEVWQNIQRGNAVQRAWAWFQGALLGLLGFVSQIPTLFLTSLTALEVGDLVLVPRAFAKVATVFAGFIGEFLRWGGNAVWKLLEIIFEVVSPATLTYLRRTGAALLGILKDPLPFVRNLVRAAKLGLQGFADNFTTHLKTGLLEWLTGALPGVYVPQAFSLGEIVKLVFSVLGISWQNLRGKLVKAVGENAVKTMEAGFDVVVTLVTEGPAAAWEKIKEHLTDLKDTVIGGITDFVVDTVVKKALPKLVAMFIPGAGFISAILSIYDTIMVFVAKLSRIGQVVASFVDSIVAIAGGAIDAAAKRVEGALAGVLSLVISFLAGFAGLGNVADKVMGVIKKVRATVEKALDALVAWIVKGAKGLFAKGKAAVKKLIGWAFATKSFNDDEGKSHSLYVSEGDVLTVASAPKAAKEFVNWYVREQDGDAAQGKAILGLIAKAQKVVDEIAKVRQRSPDTPPAPAKQRELLELNTEICEKLAKLIGGDDEIGKLQAKYLLEGQVGTYATIPKPVGDQLTPDHQPQASVILGAADFFRDRLKIKGGPLAERAEQRAAQGYAINLHFTRHVAGRTYGSKGDKRKDFYRELVKDVPTADAAAAKKEVATRLRALAKQDAVAMKVVVAKALKDEVWRDLSHRPEGERKGKKLKSAETLRNQIASRVDAGESQIMAQPFDF